jgi:polyhydroxyalkanoate synthesis repressor PhaR
MPYVIKRYANRKLYDTRTKRYLTLEEVAVLIRSGEDVRVEDADSGDDLTSSILSKIIAEGHRKGGALELPQKLLVDLIQRPSETVLGAVRTSVSAGQRTVGQMSDEVGRLIDSVTGRSDRAGKAAAEGDRLRALLAELGLPTREDFDDLAARVAALEAAAAKKPARRVATKKKS